LVLSARSSFRNAFRCANYEGEDVLATVDAADLVELKANKGLGLSKDLHKRLVFHDFSKTLVRRNFAFEPIDLQHDYDLFVAYMPLSQDLVHVPAVRGWRDRCRTAVCWIEEIWAAEVPHLNRWLPALEDFDHLFVSLNGSVQALSKATGREWRYMPLAVDATRFSPYPLPPARVIDVYSMGRRSEPLHRALVEYATKNRAFFVHDTLNSGSFAMVANHRAHRDMLANLMKRSRYFVVAPAKVDAPDETGGQVEIGLRYFEGAMAGAVMIGQIPQCEAFSDLFPWPDGVIPVNADGSDLAEVLSGLEACPQRVEEIGRRNAREALLRHDWVYRWKRILQIAGLDPAPELELREKALARLAEQVDERA
jgi:hypothetical protein